MPIDRSGSVGGNIPENGVQARFRITQAEFRPETRYGPDIELELQMIDEDYFGTPARFWVRLQQPRMDKVRKMRAEGMSDALIKEALKEQGFKVKKVDEKDSTRINRGGNAYGVLLATCRGDHQNAEAMLDKLNSFDELAKYLKGKSFAGTTKVKKKDDKSYVNVDGKEEIYPDMGPPEQVEDEVTQDLPYEYDKDAPEAPFSSDSEDTAA